MNVYYSVLACYRETCDVWLRTRGNNNSPRARRDESLMMTASATVMKYEERRHQLSSYVTAQPSVAETVHHHEDEALGVSACSMGEHRNSIRQGVT